ncbi:hypothetical protein [Adhaeretor mobilis]|uniref:hypothetical protein n=1 Tax=Adhaeretor mobilis TaxID=1930276 RepID=UPI001C54C77D|nr:hypothetical protein [Adhaeretor mobilis]
MLKISLHCVLITLVLAHTAAFGVTIDPASPVGATNIRGGWNIKAWPTRFNTIGEAQDLNGHFDANILRIPMFATAHNADGSVGTSAYSTEVDAIRSVLAVNPDVEIFSGLKLQRANTFPAWVSEGAAQWPVETGGIFGNTVQRHSPDHYSTMVADYLTFIKREVINTTLGTQPFSTTPSCDGKGDPDDEPLYQAFVEGNSVQFWIVNADNTIFNRPIDQITGQLLTDAASVETTFYGAIDNDISLNEIFSLPVTFDADAQGFWVNVFPAQLVVII